MESSRYDVLIVGAGLTGAVIAYRAREAGLRALVIDRRSHIAGNVYTEEVEGINVHRYGAHIFHTSDRPTWEFVNRFAEFNGYVNSPIVNYHGEIYNLPFNMNTFSKMWGIATPDEARAKIEEQRAAANIGEPKNLEEQALKLVGRDIFQKLIKGYTEKQWGRDCAELPASIIKRLPCRFTYDNNYFNDRFQGIPVGGYTKLVQRMLAGTEVLLNTTYRDFEAEHPHVAQQVVYCGPIDEFYGYDLGQLEYRSLRFETEVLDTPNYQGVAVVNYTDRETPWTRIIEHKHFEFGTQERTVVTREYPADWHPGDEPYYAVTDDRNRALYEKYLARANEQGEVMFAGRLGEYRYYDMDKAIIAAQKVAGRVLERAAALK